MTLNGPVDQDMFRAWSDALAAARPGDGAVVVELSTTGGDADIGRRIADDVRLFREQTGRRMLFLGKSAIYSAGVTIMGAFRRDDRWLARQAVLMIHGRKLSKCLALDGPLRFERPKVEALLAEIDEGLRVQRAGFAQLIEDSDLTLDALEGRAATDWYLPADEALRRGLVAGVI